MLQFRHIDPFFDITFIVDIRSKIILGLSFV